LLVKEKVIMTQKERMQRFVGLGLCAVFMVAGCATAAELAPAKPARWTDPNNWRTKLKAGMSSTAVKDALGEPAYEEFGRYTLTLHYQTSGVSCEEYPEPLSVGNGKTPPEYIGFGVVYFSTRPSKSRKTTAGAAADSNSVKSEPSLMNWAEPRWELMPSQKPGERTPRKQPVPSRKLEQWEVDKNWRGLAMKMEQRTVEQALGKPTAEVEIKYAGAPANAAYVEWQYGTGNSRGCVKFTGVKGGPRGSMQCHDWAEPFWPAIERTWGEKKVKNEK
jgi:hypothetical protein